MSSSLTPVSSVLRYTGKRVVEPQRAVEIEHSLEQLSRWMDNKFEIPGLGWRFGLNFLIDWIPGIGDTATTLVAIYILFNAVRYRAPKITLLRMGLNIAIYFVLGLIPFVGDVLGAWWKPNIRNINLLRSRAAVSAAQARGGRTSDWLFVGAIALFLLSLLAASFALIAFISYYFFWFVYKSVQV